MLRENKHSLTFVLVRVDSILSKIIIGTDYGPTFSGLLENSKICGFKFKKGMAWVNLLLRGLKRNLI